ncbi:hypothetical protein [Allomesorhizobium camelthorni]|uniref:Uncharacterized protein n=1 Tax=Allomesorhizobium camelthorni TaxID=475069 RepID=A0A6G4WIM0_9HYPH|nr:hypothetical protein [Mesorhizobium camelthorni]NGO54449.1 hypothetical protein [Mesorhizobium camelthorni]
MDWNAAIEKNREALKRILSALVAMAGLADGRGGTLPRHLHRAVLRLLRPAEAATRRLVIAAARGVVVAPPRPRKPEPGPPVLGKPAGGAVPPDARTAMRPMTLPLLDPLRLPSRRRPVAGGVPRISVPGFSAPFSLPPPPSPDDPVNAARLGLRLAALASALDDLPAHARRFARWRADAAGAQNREARNLPHGRPRRLWPLRPGRPPGWRRRPEHEVDEVLNNAHGLAFWALERPDTS